MDQYGPKQEPVAWATVTGLVLAALASYGLDVSPELKELLIYAVPIVAAAAWARWQVTPTPKAEAEKDAAWIDGVEAGAEMQPTVPVEQWGVNRAQKAPQATESDVSA